MINFIELDEKVSDIDKNLSVGFESDENGHKWICLFNDNLFTDEIRTRILSISLETDENFVFSEPLEGVQGIGGDSMSLFEAEKYLKVSQILFEAVKEFKENSNDKNRI